MRDVRAQHRDVDAAWTATVSLAALLAGRGSVDDAERLYRQVLEESPPETAAAGRAAVALGGLLHSRYDFDGGMDCNRRALASSDRTAAGEAAVQLASMLLQREELAEADAVLPIAMTAGDRVPNVGRLDIVADMLLRQGSYVRRTRRRRSTARAMARRTFRSPAARA